MLLKCSHSYGSYLYLCLSSLWFCFRFHFWDQVILETLGTCLKLLSPFTIWAGVPSSFPAHQVDCSGLCCSALLQSSAPVSALKLGSSLFGHAYTLKVSNLARCFVGPAFCAALPWLVWILATPVAVALKVCWGLYCWWFTPPSAWCWSNAFPFLSFLVYQTNTQARMLYQSSIIKPTKYKKNLKLVK